MGTTGVAEPDGKTGQACSPGASALMRGRAERPQTIRRLPRCTAGDRFVEDQIDQLNEKDGDDSRFKRDALGNVCSCGWRLESKAEFARPGTKHEGAYAGVTGAATSATLPPGRRRRARLAAGRKVSGSHHDSHKVPATDAGGSRRNGTARAPTRDKPSTRAKGNTAARRRARGGASSGTWASRLKRGRAGAAGARLFAPAPEHAAIV
jgi:hypothetical protein